jgi:hypothetical protein
VEEYNAAVTIQSWFRGCRLRVYLKWVLLECMRERMFDHLTSADL